jgi:hypothetical protein
MMMLYLPEVCGTVETWQTRNNKIDRKNSKPKEEVRRRKRQWSRESDGWDEG